MSDKAPGGRGAVADMVLWEVCTASLPQTSRCAAAQQQAMRGRKPGTCRALTASKARGTSVLVAECRQ